jgi:hypothetical protein
MTMNYATHQPYGDQAMQMFGPHAQAVDVTQVHARLIRQVPRNHSGLSGLGAMAAEGVGGAIASVTGGITSIIGAITGSTAAAQTQQDTIALAQVQAQKAALQAQATSMDILYAVGGLGVAAIAVAIIMKKA